MYLLFAVLLALIGGALNGSFAVPSKLINNTSKNQIWLHFSYWAYVIIPILTLFIFCSSFVIYYKYISIDVLLTLFIGGFIWGAGMICCLLAFKHVGISITFGINIGLATAGGSILPLVILNQSKLLTPFGIIIILSFILFIIGVTLVTIAARIRDRDIGASLDKNSSSFIIGIACSITAGIGSMTQAFVFNYGVSFFMKNPNLDSLSLLTRSNMPWVIIFLGAFIPNILYFKYSYNKEKKYLPKKDNKFSFKNFITEKIAIIAMAFMFFECIIFFSISGALLGGLGIIITYPIFMVFIILTSNFWGFFFKEWFHSSRKAKTYMFFAIAVLVIAVLSQTSAYFFTS